MKPIYEPKGKAKEYGDYAINWRAWFTRRWIEIQQAAFKKYGYGGNANEQS